MLGKGLESLIPNKNSKSATPQDGGVSVPNSTNSISSEDNFGEKKVDLDFNFKPKIDLNDEALEKKENQELPLVNSPLSSREERVQQRRGTEAVFQLEIEKIKPNPHQPRRHFDDEALKDLAASIREFGILQPLVVTKVEKETPSGTDVEYILIAGERRLMASKLLGLERVPAIVRRVDFERERLEMAIIENLQRENLNPIETARAFSRLQDEFNLTQREIATRLGKSREAIANSVRLLDLPAYIQDALSNNQISETHGRLLLAISDASMQQKLFKDLVENKLTTRELKERLKPTSIKDPREVVRASVDPEIRVAQERLTAKLGAPVTIEHRGENGKITISFFSEEELRSILDRISGGEND